MASSILSMEVRFEHHVVLVRQRARQIARLLGFDAQDQTRIATAVSEVARNAFQYGGGGTVEFSAEDGAPPHFVIQVRDAGPGIDDVRAVLDGNFTSTRGLGLGLRGVRKLMDRFAVDSRRGQGTTVALGKQYSPRMPHPTPPLLARIGDELAVRAPHDLAEEVQQQNQELLRTLNELRNQREELVALNHALERGNQELARLTQENAHKSEALEKMLTELKEAQAMLVHREKMSSLGQMTAGIAHEINNPLAFVLNNQATMRRDFAAVADFVQITRAEFHHLDTALPELAQQLRHEAEASELDYLLTSIPQKIDDNLRGLERVKQIVLDLRTFSRLDEATLKLSDLNEGIQSTVRFLAPLSKEHGAAIVTELAPLPPLLCNPGAINQAVSNLVINAIQASAAGKEVRIRTGQEDGWVTIVVSDQGCGIAPEHLPKVFDPFFTTKPVGKGTGLGLSITHQIVQAHGGTIQIESDGGTGTTVTVRLPMRDG